MCAPLKWLKWKSVCTGGSVRRAGRAVYPVLWSRPVKVVCCLSNFLLTLSLPPTTQENNGWTQLSELGPDLPGLGEAELSVPPRDLGTRDLIVPSKRGGPSTRQTPRYDLVPRGCGPSGLRAPLFNKRRPFFQPSKLPKGFSEEREQIQSNHNCCTSFRS